jgi:glutamate synthase (NADPH/NADH) large chain
VDEIVRRFKTGAMSYGSISKEAHETQAIAMNRMGARATAVRAARMPTASARSQRGLAQQRHQAGGLRPLRRHGCLPGQRHGLADQNGPGGQAGRGRAAARFQGLSLDRQDPARTPYVGLISPPPHHDIYSIEDLAQLIHDLKNANPRARINVKLVSEVGVGTVAAGVAKARLIVILISGESGGTGASPQGSIRHAGLPWELGLAETQQTLLFKTACAAGWCWSATVS